MDAGHTVRTSTCRTETAGSMWRPFLSKEERPGLLKGGLVPVISEVPQMGELREGGRMA